MEVANVGEAIDWVYKKIVSTFSNVDKLQDSVNELDTKKAPLASPSFTNNVQIAGNLLLKGAGNFGNKINFGDGDSVHLYEVSNNELNVKADRVNIYNGTTLVAYATGGVLYDPSGRVFYHPGNITISTAVPSSALPANYIHHVY